MCFIKKTTKSKSTQQVLVLSLIVMVGLCYGAEEKHEQQKSGLKLDERTKEILLKEKEKTHVVMEKTLEFFLNNPNRKFEKQCFEQKFKPGESIDFVIDVAPSPALDKVDKSIAESPISLYLEIMGLHASQRTPSRTYFNAISTFIEAVTFDMKPEQTHSILCDQGRKYYLRGKSTEQLEKEKSSLSDFSDSTRNLKTMWPSQTKEFSASSFLQSVIKNNLGRMTKLALWNRNNGLPSVLAGSRRSKPIFTVLISDGASGSKLSDLVGEDEELLSRTLVIDIGNRRFMQSLDWYESRRLLNVVALAAPQQLATLIDSCRFMVCRACGC